MKRILGFLIAAILGIGCGLCTAVNYEVTTVTDGSMEPALLAGKHVLVDRMQWGEKSFDRGDIVLFANPMYTETGESAVMMKRIVGIAGEWISISEGCVCIDGEPLDESEYLSNRLMAGGHGETMVKRFVDGGQYFVLGDNRLESTDSRSEVVGLVNADDIQGKVIKVW